MKPRLTYYFSTGSRYSFLSMSQIPAIEQRYGVKFDWVPVNGKRIRALRGADPFQGPPQSGQYDWGYRERDAAAWAELYGIAYAEPVNVEFDVELLLRAVIAAAHLGDVRSYAWALAQQVFVHQSWPLDDQVVQQVARQLDYDVETFNTLRLDPSTQRQLEENCTEAVQRGAFGTPSVFVGDDLFWGNDRLVLLRHRLSKLAQARPGIQVVGLDHVVLKSHEPKQLVAFYTQLFGAEVERDIENFLWQIRIGDSLLDIMASSSAPGDAVNMDHFCVRVEHYDEAALLATLAEHAVIGEPMGDIYGAQGFGASLYFTDPQGNRVELKSHKP